MKFKYVKFHQYISIYVKDQLFFLFYTYIYFKIYKSEKDFFIN